MVGACPRFWRWTRPCRLRQWNVCKSCFRIHDILDSCSSWRAPTWAYRFIASGLALEWIATRLIPNTSINSNEFSNFCTNIYIPTLLSTYLVSHQQFFEDSHGAACRYRYLFSYISWFAFIAQVPKYLGVPPPKMDCFLIISRMAFGRLFLHSIPTHTHFIGAGASRSSVITVHQKRRLRNHDKTIIMGP